MTADEIEDPHELPVRLWVNEDLKQNYNTNDMAHKIPRIIEWVTSIHDLEPGDVIATGTNHRGNHHRTFSAFQDGDTIDVEVQGLGTEQFSVRYALKRTWAGTAPQSLAKTSPRKPESTEGMQVAGQAKDERRRKETVGPWSR